MNNRRRRPTEAPFACPERLARLYFYGVSMRHFFKLSLVLAAGAASACSTPETIVKTENIPTAGVRFINAVPDTNAMDFRFIDIVESNAHYNIGCRNGPSTVGGVTGAAQIEYKNARAGSRHFRIFLSDPN